MKGVTNNRVSSVRQASYKRCAGGSACRRALFAVVQSTCARGPPARGSNVIRPQSEWGLTAQAPTPQKNGPGANLWTQWLRWSSKPSQGPANFRWLVGLLTFRTCHGPKWGPSHPRQSRAMAKIKEGGGTIASPGMCVRLQRRGRPGFSPEFPVRRPQTKSLQSGSPIKEHTRATSGQPPTHASRTVADGSRHGKLVVSD